MSYVVIHYFTDLKDKNHAYHEGDTFPRDGVSVSEERIFELSTDRNKQKRPLIKFVEDNTKELDLSEDKEKSGYTKTDINRMSTAELKTLAKSENIDNAEEMTGAELKKVLIEHFNL